MQDNVLQLAGKTYQSRLLVGTGKYIDLPQTQAAIDASGAEIVTFAVRRTPLHSKPQEKHLLDYISPKHFTLLPNTAGCFTAQDAVRTCRLARELLEGHNLVKLEVLSNSDTLYPNVIETLAAAKCLIKENFQVMVYTNDDPIIAKELEQLGCIAIMPLAAPIGSGLGIQNKLNLQLIIEQAQVPVLVDAGVGTASDAAVAMELGCDGVLMNTAIAKANDPILMAQAMKEAISSGRKAFLAGRMPKKQYGSASSPKEGLITQHVTQTQVNSS